VAYGLWNWEKLWKECGSPGGPGFHSQGTIFRKEK